VAIYTGAKALSRWPINDESTLTACESLLGLCRWSNESHWEINGRKCDDDLGFSGGRCIFCFQGLIAV
jgi:hypothetical protein